MMKITVKYAFFILLLLCQSAMASLNPTVINAARVGNLNVIEQYISSGSNVNATDSNGYTLLILAVYHAQYPVTRYLLANGADPAVLDNHGRSALMGAAFKNDMKSAQILLDNPRTDINQQNNAGQTAAMYAALFGHQDFLAFLITKGAMLNLYDKKGNNAASLAAAQGNQALASWIVARTAP